MNKIIETIKLHLKLKCGDFRLGTPIIYAIMTGDPCCRMCHTGKHREFGERTTNMGTTYTVCCSMASFCIKNPPSKIRADND